MAGAVNFGYFVILILLAATQFIVSCEAAYPNTKPFKDKCTGTKKAACMRKKGCTFSENQAPDCFEIKYLKQKPPYTDEVDLVSRFFTFSYGVHLTEGTNQKWLRTGTVAECARQCLSSPAGESVRCLSFDYYPHEVPQNNETIQSGYCVLNSENGDTARLRNEDMGLTDAELLYTSHFTRRPFSPYSGYYELRDPRGGEISKMLEYNQNVPFQSINYWPKSRWGLMHLELPRDDVQNGYVCPPPDSNRTIDPPIIPADLGANAGSLPLDIRARFAGVYTPVDDAQRCPGKMTKPEAQKLCEDSGGYLCTKQQLAASTKYKLGCGIDGFPIWANLDNPGKRNSTKKFARCCSGYRVLNTCKLFTQSQVDFCSSFKTVTQCTMMGGGARRQTTQGFGRFRNASLGAPNGQVTDWIIRDTCIWCQSRVTSEEQGECRPGNTFGICPLAPDASKLLFALQVKTYCGDSVTCPLARAYPDLVELLNANVLPTPNPTTPPTKSPTVRPTKLPTSARPSKSPSRSPTTSRPTNVPSKAPVTSVPTKSPSTSMPSRAPSFSPTTSHPSFSPSTSTPTSSPSTSIPSNLPTLPPSISPSTSMPSKSPSQSPTHSKPTFSPSSSIPTKAPSTALPSSLPTLSPTHSKPTLSPSSSTPTKAPSTVLPSSLPTLSPTHSKPTFSPSSSTPTKAPSTALPSSLPTLSPTYSSPSSTPSTFASI